MSHINQGATLDNVAGVGEKPGESLDEAELLQLCVSALAAYKQPKRISIFNAATAESLRRNPISIPFEVVWSPITAISVSCQEEHTIGTNLTGIG